MQFRQVKTMHTTFFLLGCQKSRCTKTISFPLFLLSILKSQVGRELKTQKHDSQQKSMIVKEMGAVYEMEDGNLRVTAPENTQNRALRCSFEISPLLAGQPPMLGRSRFLNCRGPA
jgi:hypothetical protein